MRGAFPDPLDELRKARMRTKRIDRGKVTRQFGFGQRGVYFIVTNLVEQHDRTALTAPKARGQMVQALLGVRWNRALAQGANRRTRRVIHRFFLSFCRITGMRLPQVKSEWTG